MKKLVILLAFVCVSAFPMETESGTNTVSTRLCDFWRYSSGNRDYACAFLGSRVNLVEAREYERTIRTLEGEIRALKSRLEALEAGERR